MSTVEGSQNCTRYCWGPFHAHSQSDSLSRDLWMIGKTLTHLPSLFEGAASYQDPLRSIQPLTQRVVDNIILGFMALTALGAAPVVMASAGTAYVAEQFLGKVDAIPHVAEKVQVRGDLINEQKKLIENFGPLLELPGKIPLLAERAEKKAEQVEKDTEELKELQQNYPSNENLLRTIKESIAHISQNLPSLMAEKNSTGADEQLLQEILNMRRKISEKEEEIKKKGKLLQALMAEARKEQDENDRLEKEMTYLTQRKERQLSTLVQNVDSIV
jgi:uncharacterized protein (UPF0335 family)